MEAIQRGRTTRVAGRAGDGRRRGGAKQSAAAWPGGLEPAHGCRLSRAGYMTQRDHTERHKVTAVNDRGRITSICASAATSSDSSVGADELREGLNFRTAEAVQELGSQDARVREEALLTLADVGAPHTLAVLDRVCERLEDTQGEVRMAALKVVEAVRSQVPEDLGEALAERLQLANDEVKLVLLAALFLMDERAAGCESYVADELALRMNKDSTSKDDNNNMDEIAVAALQVLGKVAPLCGPDEIKKILQCLSRPQNVIRQGALLVLAQVPLSDVVADLCLSSLLSILMVDESADCRFLAATAIGTIVPPPKMRQYQTDLIFMLGDDSEEVRSAVALALSSVDIPSAESVSRLVDLVREDKAKDVRRGAYLALIEIAAKSPTSEGDGKQAIDMAADAMERYQGEIMSEIGSIEQEIAEAGAHESSKAFLDFLNEKDGDETDVIVDQDVAPSDSSQAQVLEQLLGEAGEAELFVPESWTEQDSPIDLPGFGMDGINDSDSSDNVVDGD